MNPTTEAFRGSRSRRRRGIGLVAVSALVLVGVAAAPAVAKGAKIERSPRVQVEGKKLPASDKVGSAADPAIGRTAPTLVGKGFNAKKVTIGGTGTPRIILFLSHSCPHCQREVPLIVDLAAAGVFDGVEVDTVTTNTSDQLPNYPPSKWLAREKWPFGEVLLDDAKLRAFFGSGGQAFPYFIMVDSAGVVVARAEGELGKDVIRGAVANLVAGKPIFPTA